MNSAALKHVLKQQWGKKQFQPLAYIKPHISHLFQLTAIQLNSGFFLTVVASSFSESSRRTCSIKLCLCGQTFEWVALKWCMRQLRLSVENIFSLHFCMRDSPVVVASYGHINRRQIPGVHLILQFRPLFKPRGSCHLQWYPDTQKYD